MHDDERNDTVVVKDVIPYRFRKKVVEEGYKLMLREKKKTRHLQALIEKKKEMVTLQRNICAILQAHVKHNNAANIHTFGLDFLKELMEDTKAREKELSIAVMGEQSCVEMSEEACKVENLSFSFVQSAQVKRQLAADRLKLIVMDRESVFASIEILTRQHVATTAGELPSEVIEYSILKREIEGCLQALKACER